MHQPELWEEVQTVVAGIDGEACRTKISYTKISYEKRSHWSTCWEHLKAPVCESDFSPNTSALNTCELSRVGGSHDESFNLVEPAVEFRGCGWRFPGLVVACM